MLRGRRQSHREGQRLGSAERTKAVTQRRTEAGRRQSHRGQRKDEGSHTEDRGRMKAVTQRRTEEGRRQSHREGQRKDDFICNRCW